MAIGREDLDRADDDDETAEGDQISAQSPDDVPPQQVAAAAANIIATAEGEYSCLIQKYCQSRLIL